MADPGERPADATNSHWQPGGQQQRIALARALVFQPRLLVLDEPLAALDKQLREAMQLELKRIQLETGTRTVAVTHDQVEAMSMADHVAIMNGGRLVQVGTPEDVYRRPADLFVATFLGEANLLPVDNQQVRGFGLPVRTALPRAVAVVRPEDLTVSASDAPGTPRAEMVSDVFQGTRRRLTLRVTGIEQPLIVSAPPQLDFPAPGRAAYVRLNAPQVHLVAGDVDDIAANTTGAAAGAVEANGAAELVR